MNGAGSADRSGKGFDNLARGDQDRQRENRAKSVPAGLVVELEHPPILPRRREQAACDPGDDSDPNHGDEHSARQGLRRIEQAEALGNRADGGHCSNRQVRNDKADPLCGEDFLQTVGLGESDERKTKRRRNQSESK